MKEHRIIFTAAEVEAYLAGRKTQARRVIKPQPTSRAAGMYPDLDDGSRWVFDEDEYGEWHRTPCPYGQPGDRLWVAETWGLRLTKDHPTLGAFGHWLTGQADLLRRDNAPMVVVYRADRNSNSAYWRPATQMPRWASRITLEITGVRVEQVQDISRDDALAEDKALKQFPVFWDLRNANRGYDWDKNPWVWVLELPK